MFVGFNADGNDGISFVTFIDLASGTNIRFNDNEWNGSAIGGGGAFNTGETSMTWQNNTGNSIRAGTVITINNSNSTPTASIGTITGGTIDVANQNEVIYMFLGTDASTPTVFLSAIANDTFTNGIITNTGLTAGTNAISIAGDEDVMVYNGSINCTSTIANCATLIATATNWSTQDTGADDSTNGFPDFPTNVPCNFYGAAFGVLTYYSRNATLGGNWDDNNSWTTISDGSGAALTVGVWPRRHDNVIILSGHTITINATSDNQTCGVSPDGLGRTNVGPFAASNLNMFYQTGDIQINGTLTVTGIEMMTEGYTKILSGGVFSLGSSYVNLGFLEADAGSTLSSGDDLILAGFSSTIINTTSISNDDLIISFTDATLCGTGVATLTNGGGSLLTFANGATISQICTSFTVNCTGGGCSGFPVVGTTTVLLGNVGPGGVGNSTNNKLWLKADDLSLANGAAVNSWADASGNGLTAVSSGVSGQAPTFNTNTVNTILPSISFDGGDFLNLGNASGLNLIPGTNSWSFFIAYNVAGATPQGTFFSKATNANRQYQYTIDDNGPNSFFTAFIGGNNTIGTVIATNAWFVSSHTNTTTQKDSWTNEGVNFAAQAIGAAQDPTADVLIGARRDTGPTAGTGFLLTGSIAEIAMYNTLVNQAQRIITSNAFAAKYNVTLSANDLYTMDNSANGNYDFEVAGIGQVNATNKHIDAKGKGMVRMWNPNNLGNNEFLIWGRDNSSAISSTTAVGTSVDGTIIKERLTRIWRVSESGGDVGTVSISFDFSSLGGSPLGSNMRLLIDRNGNGFADNDVTPVVGSSSGSIIVFSGINFQDGDRFTLGNTSLSTPLPVELISFYAKAQDKSVLLTWSTATEINNKDFTIERSQNAKEWSSIGTVNGAGNSAIKVDYQFIDEKPKQGTSYYRLKQTDFDGAFKYSNVVSVDREKINEIYAYPNPSTSSFTLVSDVEILPSQIRFINMLGGTVSVSIAKKETETIVDPGDISAGIYFIQVSSSAGIKTIRVVRK